MRGRGGAGGNRIGEMKNSIGEGKINEGPQIWKAKKNKFKQMREEKNAKGGGYNNFPVLSSFICLNHIVTPKTRFIKDFLVHFDCYRPILIHI